MIPQNGGVKSGCSLVGITPFQRNCFMGITPFPNVNLVLLASLMQEWSHLGIVVGGGSVVVEIVGSVVVTSEQTGGFSSSPHWMLLKNWKFLSK